MGSGGSDQAAIDASELTDPGILAAINGSGSQAFYDQAAQRSADAAAGNVQSFLASVPVWGWLLLVLVGARALLR